MSFHLLETVRYAEENRKDIKFRTAAFFPFLQTLCCRNKLVFTVAELQVQTDSTGYLGDRCAIYSY